MATHRIAAIPAAIALFITALAVPVADASESDTVAIDRGMLLYELNRARWNPADFAARAGDVVFPAGLLPAPPLAPNSALMDSAGAKADEMALHSYFSHQSEVTGMWPNELARTSGFDLPDSFRDEANGIESIYAGSSRVMRVLSAFARSTPHRAHLFGVGGTSSHTEFGAGRSIEENYWAIHSAYSDPAARFVTGAVFEDVDGDGVMSWGEGIEGVTVAVGMVEVTTDVTGLYSVPAESGTHEVRFEPVGSAATSVIVEVDDYNVWVDLPVGDAAIVRSYALCGGESPTILGTSGDDTLLATDGRDVILGLGGDDVVVGAEANDVVCSSGEPGVEAGAPTSLSIDQSVERVGGIDRYATAVEMSQAIYPSTTEVVYLATGANYPDALAAAPAAAADHAPILLVRSDGIPAVTARELERLSPASVVVLGGTSSISDHVVSAVRGLLPGVTVRRLAGPSRFETAVAISMDQFSPDVGVVYVANGWGFADALVGAPAAHSQGGPLLLVDRSSVPKAVAAEISRLQPRQIVILGSENSISHVVEAELSKLADDVVRVSGDTRYATAVAVSKHAFPDGAPSVQIAVGTNFPDALAGGAAAFAARGPILLVGSDWIPPAVTAEISRLGVTQVIVLGGPSAVSGTVERDLRALLG